MERVTVVLERASDDNGAMRTPRSRTHSRSLLLSLSLSPSLRLTRESAWINNAYPRARTREKSTAMVARGASPRTPAIAHTYLYTVIFKMKERRAGSRVVVERALADWRARALRGGKDRVQTTTAIDHIFTSRALTVPRRRRRLRVGSRPERRRTAAHNGTTKMTKSREVRAESFAATARRIRATPRGYRRERER